MKTSATGNLHSATLREFIDLRFRGTMRGDNIEQTEAACVEISEMHVQILAEGYPARLRESFPRFFVNEDVPSTGEYVHAWWMDLKLWMASLSDFNRQRIGSEIVCWKGVE